MKEQNNNINTDSFPKIREFKNKLLHYYADTNILEDDSIYQLCCNILSVDGAESPLVVLPDVSKKNERISPTGITLSSHSHIIPSALPAANGSGVRVIKLDISQEEINDDAINTFLKFLSLKVPIYGYDSPDLLRPILRKEDLMNIYAHGAQWAQERLGIEEDITRIESNGRFGEISEFGNELFDRLPEYFINQGLYGFGILESGNHFVELQFVDKVLDHDLAELLNIRENQVFVMIHDGNPATLAAQYYHPVPLSKKRDSEFFEKDKHNYHFIKNKTPSIEPDPIRYFSPSASYFGIKSDTFESEKFMLLMNAACNYGFANRVAITRAVLDSVNNALRKDFINYELITDTLHDCVKETHINGKNVFIHRHGASEAQPKSNFNSDSIFSKTGQVVGIPGSPGRHSMICAADSGTAKTFFTVNHGAGRKLDRGEAQKKYTEDETYNEISISGASLMRRGLGDFSGESPFAYKDLSDVFDISNKSNLLNGIARLKPLAIYKG